ncbi:MAG: zinc-binding dehydrogenase, partial [Cyclobacteriaceae bacterium]
QTSLLGSTMANDQEFLAMIRYVTEHAITPVIDSVRPFDEIVSAFDKMRDGGQTGKLVVNFPD